MIGRIIIWARTPYLEEQERSSHTVTSLDKVPAEACVISLQPDEIIIEFDKAPDFDKNICEIAIDQTFANILHSEQAYNILITGHKGFSDYIRIQNIAGMETLNPEERKAYIEAFYEKYIPQEYQAHIDRGFTNKFRLIQMIDKPHWKTITHYNGQKWPYTAERILLNQFPNCKNKIEQALLNIARNKANCFSTSRPATAHDCLPIEVKKFEDNCPAIKGLTIRTDLKHNERTALLFNYALLGKNGITRLKEILAQQRNYKSRTTENIITPYVKKNKFLGISCQKMQQWGICKEACK